MRGGEELIIDRVVIGDHHIVGLDDGWQRIEGTPWNVRSRDEQKVCNTGRAERVTGDGMGKEQGNRMDWSPREQE